MRFLFCAQPIIGHVEPGLLIADALRTRGHEIAWYAGSCVRGRIEAAGHRCFPVVAGFDYDGTNPNAFFPAREGLTGIADLKFILKDVFAEGMAGQAKDITEILTEFPADVVVADFVTFGPRVVHELGGPPWAAYGFSALSLSSVDTAPYGLGLSPKATAAGRLRNRTLSWLMKRVVMRDVVRHHDGVRKKLGLAALDAGPTDTPLSPFLFLQGTVEAFEYRRSDLPPQVHYVGALSPKPASSLFVPPEWWVEVTEKKRPVVLVTQGTMDNKDLSELIVPTLSALSNEDVLVVATTGRDVAPSELGSIPGNARVDRFVPYHELLPHVDVMVSNAGYNGVLVALANGVPIVAAGAHSDKPEICSRVAWSGAGLRLHSQRPRPVQIRNAVRKLLEQESFKRRAKDLSLEFRRHDGGARSAELLEALARTSRPVLRSQVSARK